MHFLTELFLAWRYFKPKRSAVSVITLISVIGVMLGVCVLIVVLAVMTGFSDRLKSKLLETGSHGQVQKALIKSERHPEGAAGRFSPDEYARMDAFLRSAGAEETAAVLNAPVLVQIGESFEPKILIAFDPKKETPHFPVRDAVKRAQNKSRERAEKYGIPPRSCGEYSLRNKEVMISSPMADEFKLNVGDKIILHTPYRLMSMIKKDEHGRYVYDESAEKYVPAEFTISAIYSFDIYRFDQSVIFMGLDEADILYGLDWGDSTHIYLWTKNPFRMDDFNDKVYCGLADDPQNAGIFYRSWKDINHQMLDVLAVEKNMMFFLLVFIVLVAAFSITNTLITTVIQKTKEIGLLKATGATSGAVMRIFVLQGAFVGVIGTCLGVLSGWLVVIYRMDILEAMRVVTGMEIFPKEMYLFSELPAHIVWGDVALISVISIALCTCGALIPAFRAAKLDPAKALRYES